MKQGFKDVTFIIPFRMDSRDRLENLYLTTDFLMKYLDTHIIVIEVDGIPKVNKARLHSAIHYEFITNKSAIFHRTKYLNIGAKQANTDIICLYDADILVSIKQMHQAVDAIRKNDMAMAIPSDGRVAYIERAGLCAAKLPPTLKSLYRYLPQTWSIRNSVGGCCFLNKNTYLASGGENEHFKAWGKEDLERYKRLRILGHKVCRIPGFLFHINHFRGVNSDPNRVPYILDSDKEYMRVCLMDKEVLQEYILTWKY